MSRSVAKEPRNPRSKFAPGLDSGRSCQEAPRTGPSTDPEAVAARLTAERARAPELVARVAERVAHARVRDGHEREEARTAGGARIATAHGPPSDGTQNLMR